MRYLFFQTLSVYIIIIMCIKIAITLSVRCYLVGNKWCVAPPALAIRRVLPRANASTMTMKNGGLAAHRNIWNILKKIINYVNRTQLVTHCDCGRTHLLQWNTFPLRSDEIINFPGANVMFDLISDLRANVCIEMLFLDENADYFSRPEMTLIQCSIQCMEIEHWMRVLCTSQPVTTQSSTV